MCTSTMYASHAPSMNIPLSNTAMFCFFQQGQMISEAKMEDEFIEGRMDFEKNDYGPTTSNPVHTPRPPR